MKSNFINFFLTVILLITILQPCFSQSRIDELQFTKLSFPYFIRQWTDTSSNRFTFYKWGTNYYWSQKCSFQNILNLKIDCDVSSSFIPDSVEFSSKPFIIIDKKTPLFFDPEKFKPIIKNPVQYILKFTIDTRDISNKWQDVKALIFDVEIFDAKISTENEIEDFQVKIPIKPNQLYQETKTVTLSEYIERPEIKILRSPYTDYKKGFGVSPNYKKIFAWWFINLNNSYSYTDQISICHYVSQETFIIKTDTLKCTNSHCVNGVISSYTYQEPVYNTVIEYVPEQVWRSTIYGDYAITTGHKRVTKTVFAGYKTVEVPTHGCPICKGTGKIFKDYQKPVLEWYAWDLKIVNILGAQLKIYNPLKGVYEELGQSNDLDCVFYFVNEKNLPIIVTYQNADYYLVPIDNRGRPLKKIIIN